MVTASSTNQRRLLLHYGIVGSVVLFHDIANKTSIFLSFFLQQGWYILGLVA